jgi:hypothetical protein
VAALGLGALFAFAGLIGWLAAHRWTSTPELTGSERLFVWITLGVLIMGWSGVALAEAGAFRLLWLVALPLGLGLACWQARKKVPAATYPGDSSHSMGGFRGFRQRPVQTLVPVAAVLFLVLLGFLYFRPHQYLTGGADAGVYVNLAANLARTGRLIIAEPTLTGMDPTLYPLLLRALPPSEGAPYNYLPGFYATNPSLGEITPQFYPLHPIWLGIASLVGGLQGSLLMVPAWALLGVIALYFTARSWWGNGWGMLAAGALSLTALQIWFARYPTAEMLTQYLFWTGAWALGAWLGGRKPAGLWALMAGLALGEVILTRIDMYVLVALPAAVALWSAHRGRWQKSDLCFYLPLGLLTAHSLAHAWFFGRPYATRLWLPVPAILQSHPVWLAIIVTASVATLAFLVFFPARWRPIIKWWPRIGRAALAAGSAAIILGMLYGYFVRPVVAPQIVSPDWYSGGQIPNLDPQNVVRLGWYLGVLGLGLATAGVVICLQRDLRPATLFVISAGVFFSAYYLWHIMANPHQVYAMRRYVPVVLPFATLMATAALRGIWEWPVPWSRHVGSALTLVWIVCILAMGRGFISQVDYNGMDNQLASLDATLPPSSVVIFGDSGAVGLGDILGTPLQFLYQHPTYSIRRPELLTSLHWQEMIARWQSEGREVAWIEPEGGIGWPGQPADLVDTRILTISSNVLEYTYDRKPQSITHTDWHLKISRIRPQ